MPSVKITVLAGALALVASCACQPSFPPAEQVATAVGDPTGAAATQLVGPSGGTLTSSDGQLTLTVPPDALAATVTLSVTPLDNTAHGGVGPGWRLGPDGTTFAKPVTLSVKVSEAALARAPAGAFGFASQRADGFWKWETSASVDTTARTATASLSHFSDWSLVYGFNMRPTSRLLDVNETALFVVAFCYSPDLGDDDLTALGYECDIEAGDPETTPLLPTAKVSAWKVNGVEGGSPATGTVAGVEARATFTAPAQRPSPDTVSLSADIAWKDKGKVVAVASVTVDPPARVYKGNLQYSSSAGGDSISLTGPVTFTETSPGSGAFVASGSVASSVQVQNCLPYSGARAVTGEMHFGVPTAGQYTLSLGAESVTLSCNNVNTPFAFQLLITPPCAGDAHGAPDLISLENIVGSNTCGTGALSYSFTRTE